MKSKSNDPRISFESEMTDEEAAQSLNSGLKLKRNKRHEAKIAQKERFEQQVRYTQQEFSDHMRVAFELGKEYLKLLSDTKIPENIGPYERSFETEIIRKLIDYGETVNNNQQYKEGEGSISLILLLLKATFKFKDRANLLAYENFKLEKRLQALEKMVLDMKFKTDPSETDEARGQ